MDNQNLPEQNFSYEIVVSKKAKHIRLQVGRDLKVKVVLPFGKPRFIADQFVEKKTSWIIKSLNYLKKFSDTPILRGGRREYLKNKQSALALAQKKVLEINQYYQFPVGRVSVKNQTTRWGSCSRKGNLNFNFKIIYLPETVLNYLVAHELCHLKEMNHSAKFWSLVAQTAPNYKELRKQLKSFQ